jgi:hypothetical protein
MLVKIVDTVVSTDSAGRPVEAIPIRDWEQDETSVAGIPLNAIEIEDSEVGTPVRFVVGKTAQNSVGQWVDTIPTAWKAPTSGFAFVRTVPGTMMRVNGIYVIGPALAGQGLSA